MTMASCEVLSDRQPRRSVFAVAAVQHVADLLERLDAWNRRRIEARALEFLPAELRKDLGWPTVDRCSGRRF